MTEYVRVSALAALRKIAQADPQVSVDDANNVIGQAVEDAIHGSFGRFPSQSAPVETANFAVSTPIPTPTQIGVYDVKFEFEIPSSMFAIRYGGLQHLIGVLCGDTFRAPSFGVEWVKIEFTAIELPQKWIDDLRDEFGQYSHTVSSIRDTMGIKEAWPLLAFSYKPRTGIPFPDFLMTAIRVLESEFNVVEPDTRRITLPSELAQWAELGRRAAKVRPGATAFAPNFTLPADQVVDAARSWRTNVKNGPFVLKVDGGLDGISAVQALRRALRSEPPIVTCYPLLGGQLSRLPKGFFVKCLLWSGVDIVYPGGRPDFSGAVRALDADRARAYKSSAESYDQVVSVFNKMPTYAGGAHPADLQVASLMLGPDTAFFLGGAVALHAEGPEAGAALCHEIIKKTVRQARRKQTKELGGGVAARIEDMYGGAAEAPYFAPKFVFSETDTVQYPVLPYWERNVKYPGSL